MAYAYLRKGETPPIITTEGRENYIAALEEADRGDLKVFSDHLGDLATAQLRSLNVMTKRVLAGHHRLTHANGGVTDNKTYYPPSRADTDYDIDPGD